jgi:RHS repeat-associated protein
VQKAIGRLAFALALSLGLIDTAAGRAEAQTLPSMQFVTASLVAPATAQTYYGSATTHTNSLSGVSGFGATPPEIVETARALKGNPDTIFDFVHDQVQTEFAFGERKGPIGTLIDKSGTPFDQNVLFVNLVRQAGYSAQYQIGQVTMTAQAFTNWTGVSDLGAACRMLSSGGIPASFSPSAPANCQASGSFTSVTILHIWSQVNIGGTWYAYDPSFKTYSGPTPVNLISASGFTSGASASAAASGMSSGSTSGVNYIQNVNEGSLKTTGTVQAYDTDQVTGVTKIQQVWAPTGGWRNSTPPGYTTGSSITVTGDIPDQYRTQLKFAMSVAPDQVHYTSALSWNFFVDDIDGRRLAVNTNFNDTGGQGGGSVNPIGNYSNGNIYITNYATASVTLSVDDVALQTWSCSVNLTTCVGAQAPAQVSLTAIHPYAAGTYANETVVKQITGTGVPITIVSGWGMISPARLAKWSDEIAYDSALPTGNAPPWVCDGDGDYCFPPNLQDSTGDLTRQKLAASWLAETTRMMQLQATIGGAVVDHQHSIGVVDWRHSINGYVFPESGTPPSGPEYWGVADEFSDLNIDSVVAVTSKTDSSTSVAAISRSIALASATLEGSVLEQLEDLPDSASTASRFAWGNDPGADNVGTDLEDPCFTTNNPRPFYDYTGSSSTTRSSLYTFEGTANGCNATPLNWGGSSPYQFDTAAENTIAPYLAAGFHVTGSGETFLGPGARFGPCFGTTQTGIGCDSSSQRGTAIVATQFDGSGDVLQVAHVLSSIYGISKGGGGKQPENFATYDPSKAGDALKDRFVDRSVDLGVDLKTGAAGYTTPTLVSIGAGSEPYKLDYSLSYKAAPTGCNPYGPCTNPITGGWNHNWDVRLANSGSGLEAIGQTSPFAAAGSLVAFLAMQDIFSESSLSNLNQDVYAALAADWWRQQMAANTVTLSRGFQGKQYVRLVDGSWMPPVGSPGVLTQTGSRVKVRDSCHSFGGSYGVSTSRRWDISSVNFSLRNAGGDVMAFAPWSWNYDPAHADNCAKVEGFEPTTWTFPQGVSLNFTYGTQTNGVTTDYTPGVTAVASSLGRTLNFTSGKGGNTGYTATANAIAVGQGTAGSAAVIYDANGSSTGGNTGKYWTFNYTSVLARSATQRPVPYPELDQIFEPVSASLPAFQYAYDTRGLVETAKDANLLQLSSESQLPPYTFYLALGGRGERDDPDSGAYTVWYDPDGDAVRNIDELSREVDSLWDGRHRVTSRTFPESDQEQFGYDTNDNVTSLTRVPKTGSGLSSTTVSATYDPTWNKLQTITDAKMNTTTFAYYPSGSGASMLHTVTQPVVTGGSPVYTFTYNSIGLLTQLQDAAGVTTSHNYDSYGNLTSTTEGAAAVGSNPALNLTTQFTPDTIGNVTATTTPLGHVSNTTFDQDRRPLLQIQPNPGMGVRTAIQTAYDANGRPIEVDKGTTNSTGQNFSALETILTTYDPNGNKTAIEVLNGGGPTQPILTLSQMSYDPLNRLLCTTRRQNPSSFNNEPAPCTPSTAGGNGPDQITQIAYDLAGEKISETRGVGVTSPGTPAVYGTYTYSLDGNLATVLDANNNLSTLSYDGLNRLLSVSFPLKTTGSRASDPSDVESYGYDANDNRTSLTKRDSVTVIDYGYDAINRRTSKTFPSASSSNVSYGFDLAGRRTSALYPDQGGMPGVTWSYDAAGREITEVTNGRSLAFTYDNDSNPATLTWPDSQQATYGFDAADRFQSIGNSSVSVTYGYDSLSRIHTITHGAQSAISYDNADRISSLAHPLGIYPVTYTLAFTPANQLITDQISNNTYVWPAQSAAAVSTTPNGLNQNATVGGTSWIYDANGNLQSDGTRNFIYDSENRLLTDTVSGATVLSLTYDPLGRLQQSTAGSTVTRYLYHGNDLVAEYNSSGSVTNRFMQGPGVDNTVIWFQGSGTAGSNASYLIADRQGSIIATANSSGTASATVTYDAYGLPNSWGAVPGFGYTGQLALPQASLWYYKARAYDPVSGKFLQTDPVGYDSDVNLYEYVGGDPVNRVDPEGLAGPQIDPQLLVDVQTRGSAPSTQRAQGPSGSKAGAAVGFAGNVIDAGGAAAESMRRSPNSAVRTFARAAARDFSETSPAATIVEGGEEISDQTSRGVDPGIAIAKTAVHAVAAIGGTEAGTDIGMVTGNPIVAGATAVAGGEVAVKGSDVAMHAAAAGASATGRETARAVEEKANSAVNYEANKDMNIPN